MVPSPGPPCDALVAFTGHFVLAADVDPAEVAARWPAGELTVPFAPASLAWLSGRIDVVPLTHDALLVTIGDGSGPPPWLQRAERDDHPRVHDASRWRSITSVWTTDDDGGLVLVGRGLCHRWEVGFDVAPARRGCGLGRRLLAAARGLIPAGEPLWAQVAPGNAASLRSTLAAGFVPVGAEVLFLADKPAPRPCAGRIGVRAATVAAHR